MFPYFWIHRGTLAKVIKNCSDGTVLYEEVVSKMQGYCLESLVNLNLL